MFQVQHNFSRDDLTRLLNLSLKKWSNGEARFECITINCDDDGQVSGYLFMRPGAGSDLFDKKSTTVNLTHELITTAVYQAASDEGSPLALNSLVFSNSKDEDMAYSTVTATASSADEAEQTDKNWPAVPPTQSGIVSFPAPVSIFFANEELQELVKASGKRAGYAITNVSLSDNETNGVSADITIKTGTAKNSDSSSLTLSPTRLNDTLATELTTRGYIVADDGLSLLQDGEGSVCAAVTVSAIPNP